MSDEIVARLRLDGQRAVAAGLDTATLGLRALRDAAQQAAEALREPRTELDALSLATERYSDLQREQSEQWQRDLDLLSAQATLLRRLRSEFRGVADVLGRPRPGTSATSRGGAGGSLASGFAGSAPALTRGAARSARLASRAFGRTWASSSVWNRLVTAPFLRARMRAFGPTGRFAARSFANAWRRGVAASGQFAASGRGAGRRMANATAATATAQAGRQFNARAGAWRTIGSRSGRRLGQAAGRSGASATVATLLGRDGLPAKLQQQDAQIRILGIRIGTLMGLSAGRAFVWNFQQMLRSSGLDAFFGMPGAKKKDDGPSLFDKATGWLGGAIGDTVDALPLGGPLAMALKPDSYDPISNRSPGNKNLEKIAAGALGFLPNGAGDLVSIATADDPMGKASAIAGSMGTVHGLLRYPGAGTLSGIGTGLSIYQLGSDLVAIGRDFDPSSGGIFADGIQTVVNIAKRPQLMGRASGGVVRSGEVTLVGERGPEIVRLPGGSNVLPAHRSRELLERRSGQSAPRARRDLHVHQHLNGREIARATIRNIDDDEQWGRR